MRMPTDNELWFKALSDWIKKDPAGRGTLTLGELTAVEFSEIFSIVNEYKQNGVEP